MDLKYIYLQMFTDTYILYISVCICNEFVKGKTFLN